MERWSRTERGIVSVVTGGGKTIFAILCIDSFLQRHPSGRVVIVVPTLTLLDQWTVDITELFGLREEEVGLYSGEGRPAAPQQINLMVLNTARTEAPDLCEHDPTFLIVDECHRAGSPENARALSGPHTASLGLSATPERESDNALAEEIIPQLGEVIYEYDYTNALDDEVIVPFSLVNIEIQASPEERRLYDEISRRLAKERSSPEDAESIRQLLERRAAVSAVAPTRIPWAVKVALLHRKDRVLIFHERVPAADRIASTLERHGAHALTYHSKLSPPLRRDNLRLFRRGEENTLVTCRALDEGTNVPETTIAIVASSTSSLRQRIQRLGRVLRPAANKRRAVVYTFYSGNDERERLASEAQRIQGVADVSWKTGTVK